MWGLCADRFAPCLQNPEDGSIRHKKNMVVRNFDTTSSFTTQLAKNVFCGAKVLVNYC